MDRDAQISQSSFIAHGYSLVRGMVGRPVSEFLFSYAVNSALAGKTMGGDRDVPDTPVLEKDPMMEALLELLLPRVEAESGMRLLPTYSYLRIYKRGDVLRRHTDRPACETSVSLNLGCEAPRPWPIWLEGRAGAQAFDLMPGDALLYRGIDLPHWREAFDGDRMAQVFLHYVDRDGPHRDWAYDKRARLAVSAASRRILQQLAGSG